MIDILFPANVIIAKSSLGYYFCVGDVSGIFVIKHLAGENGYW